MKVIQLILVCCVVCAHSRLFRAPKKTNKIIFTEAVREYSDSTYRLLARAGNARNIIFSPLSVYMTLGMLLSGAGGNTASEIRRAMRLSTNDERKSWDSSRVSKLMRKLYSNSMRNSEIILRIANGLFVQENYQIKSNFQRELVENYRTELENLNFADSIRAANRINSWVANITENRISNLVTPEVFTANTRLVLTNGVYFKASWQYPFHRSNDTTRFTRSNNVQVSATFMEVMGFFQTFSRDGIQFVAIPYNTSSSLKSYLVVGVPTSGENLNALNRPGRAQSLFRDLNINGDWNFERAIVVIPEFQISQEIDLKEEVLKQQGVREVFDDTNSDLSGISSEKLYVSEYRHKAFIAVNQIGTEAAGATFISITGRSGAGPLSIVADKPFVFGIYDAKAEIYTFVGKIEDPTLES